MKEVIVVQEVMIVKEVKTVKEVISCDVLLLAMFVPLPYSHCKNNTGVFCLFSGRSALQCSVIFILPILITF
jgi:hypothetical protein